MSSRPLVSVIVIFLNEERFIQEAIDSVFAQTYGNWELILVDDGSTDKSIEIAKQLALQYLQKVHYLEHPGHENRGMSASRNLGVRHAKGQYISYLDGDDVWLPNKLDEQVAILEAHPEAAMVHGPLQMWFSWTGDPKDLHRDHLYGVKKNGNHPYHDTLIEPPMLLELFLKHEEYIPSGFLIKRDVMAQIGVYEEEFHDGYSDAVALVKVCLNFLVFVSSKSWYKYRKHPNSYTYLDYHFSSEENNNKLEHRYWSWIEHYFNEQGVTNPKLRTVLRKLLWRHHHPRLYRLKRNLFYNPKRLVASLIFRVKAKMSHSGKGVPLNPT